MHCVGKDFQDEYSKKVKSKVKTLGLSRSVFFYDSKPDIYYVLSQCEIGVLSSKSEGLPIALLEYGLHELAVLTTDVGECNQVVSDETKGYIVPSENEAVFAEKLNILMENQHERLAKAEQLYKHIQANFAQKAIIQQLISFYNEL